MRETLVASFEISFENVFLKDKKINEYKTIKK